jgi:hypothetical protein
VRRPHVFLDGRGMVLGELLTGLAEWRSGMPLLGDPVVVSWEQPSTPGWRPLLVTESNAFLRGKTRDHLFSGLSHGR